MQTPFSGPIPVTSPSLAAAAVQTPAWVPGLYLMASLLLGGGTLLLVQTTHLRVLHPLPVQASWHQLAQSQPEATPKPVLRMAALNPAAKHGL